MDRTPRRKLNRWTTHWDTIENLAAQINQTIPALLAASAHIGSDAFGNTTLTTEIRGQGDHADPVLEHLIAHLDTAEHDVIADHLREIAAVSSEVLGHMRRINRLASIIVNRKDPRTYDVGGNCECCNRYCTGAANDRLRALYCEACYKAWCRFRDESNRQGEPASHDLFVKARQQMLAEKAEREARKEGAA